MTDLHISTPNKGLQLGTKAPKIDTEDIDGDPINLAELLKKHIMEFYLIFSEEVGESTVKDILHT